VTALATPGPLGPAEGGLALWEATLAALAAAGTEVVQAGDGRPGVVLEIGPRGLGIAVRWQATARAPLPGGVLGVNSCSRDGSPVPARQIQNMILESHLTGAGLRTAYAGPHLAVLHFDVVIPGRLTPGPAADPVHLAPGPGRLRRGLWVRLRPSRKP
jgi:hypothetical protein